MGDENKNIDLIIRHLCNETSDQEEQLLTNWLNESKVHLQFFEETKKAWELSNEKVDPEVAAVNLDDEWNKMEFVLDFGQKGKTIDLASRSGQKKFNWVRIAAIIVILIAVGGGWFLLNGPGKTELVAENKIIENKLPDGSKITLKGETELSYDENYNKDYRKVSLKGEAFFEVEHNQSKPFIVEAGDLKVEVVGTTFLVNNNVKRNISEVIVNTGKVLVFTAEDKSDSQVLEAGDKATFDKEKKQLIKSQNLDQNYIAWKTKILKFENTNLKEIVRTLNHTYNSNIVITNQEIYNCKVSLSTDNQSLESILNVLQATLNIKVSKQANKIEISGDGCQSQ